MIDIQMDSTFHCSQHLGYIFRKAMFMGNPLDTLSLLARCADGPTGFITPSITIG